MFYILFFSSRNYAFEPLHIHYVLEELFVKVQLESVSGEWLDQTLSKPLPSPQVIELYPLNLIHAEDLDAIHEVAPELAQFIGDQSWLGEQERNIQQLLHELRNIPVLTQTLEHVVLSQDLPSEQLRHLLFQLGRNKSFLVWFRSLPERFARLLVGILINDHSAITLFQEFFEADHLTAALHALFRQYQHQGPAALIEALDNILRTPEYVDLLQDIYQANEGPCEALGQLLPLINNEPAMIRFLRLFSRNQLATMLHIFQANLDFSRFLELVVEQGGGSFGSLNQMLELHPDILHVVVSLMSQEHIADNLELFAYFLNEHELSGEQTFSILLHLFIAFPQTWNLSDTFDNQRHRENLHRLLLRMLNGSTWLADHFREQTVNFELLSQFLVFILIDHSHLHQSLFNLHSCSGSLQELIRLIMNYLGDRPQESDRILQQFMNLLFQPLHLNTLVTLARTGNQNLIPHLLQEINGSEWQPLVQPLSIAEALQGLLQFGIPASPTDVDESSLEALTQAVLPHLPQSGSQYYLGLEARTIARLLLFSFPELHQELDMEQALGDFFRRGRLSLLAVIRQLCTAGQLPDLE